MSDTQELAVREKQELAKKEEKTTPGRYFVPAADIFETDEALTVIMEMPGVEKKDIDVALEEDILRVEGKIDYAKYQGMEPVYTEYMSAITPVALLCPARSTATASVRSSTTAC